MTDAPDAAWTVDRILAMELRLLGGAGAGWVSRLLPLNSSEAEWVTPHPEAHVREVVRDLLSNAKHLVRVHPYAAEGAVSAVVGSGGLRLNPALLTVWVTAVTSTRTRIRVRGEAKEGLVRQRGGEQTLREAVSALKDQLPAADETSPDGQRRDPLNSLRADG